MKSNVSVLLITYYYHPSDAAAASRPFRFASHLASLGIHPSVLTTGDPISTEVNVTRVGERGNSPFRRLVAILLDNLEFRVFRAKLRTSWAQQSIDYLRNHPQDHWEIVHSVGPPVGAHQIAAWVKRHRGGIWVADMQDPMTLPQVLIRGVRAWIGARLILPFLERYLLRNADIVIANTPAVCDMLQMKYVKWAHKVRYLPNGLDQDMNARPEPIPARDFKILAHCGDFYSVRNPVKLLDSLVRLTLAGSVSAEHLRVDFFGDLDLNHGHGAFSGWNGCSREKARQLLASPWLRVVPERVARAVAVKAMAEADYSLLIDVEGPLSKYFQPVKIFDQISIGRPILCFTEHGSPVDKLLPLTGVPYVTVYYTDSDHETDRKVAAFFKLPNIPVSYSSQLEAERGDVALTCLLASIYNDSLQIMK
jgi:glycosyltransferase involved in cell wall biosynthesis